MPRRRREMTDLSLAPSVGSKSYSHHNHHHHQQRSASSTKEKPQQRNAANARERARMRVLSRAFCRLKTTLPWVPADTKLSKLDTLRLATTYIGHLRSVLIEGSSSGSTSPVPSHPLSVSWPFMFNKSSSGFGGSGDPTGHSPVGSRSESPSSTSSSSSVASSDQFNFQDCRSGSTVSTSASDHLQLVVTHQHSAGQHHKNGDPRNLSRHPCHDDMELVSHHHHHHQHGQFSSIASDIPSHHQQQEQQPYHQTSATIAQHHGNLVVYVSGNNSSLTEIDYQHDQLMELS